MIYCDKPTEREDMRKVVYKKKEGEKGQEGKKDRDVKKFHSPRVTLPMHTRRTTALECGHLPLQVRSLNCYFQ